MIPQTQPSISHPAPNRRQPGYAPNPSPAIGEPPPRLASTTAQACPLPSPPARPSRRLPTADSKPTAVLTQAPSTRHGHPRPAYLPPQLPPPAVPWCANPLCRRLILAHQDSKQQCIFDSHKVPHPNYTSNTLRTLYPESSEERTVYLGPWKIIEGEQRRIVWQCSYENEILEHYRKSSSPPSQPLPTNTQKKSHPPIPPNPSLTPATPNTANTTTPPTWSAT